MKLRKKIDKKVSILKDSSKHIPITEKKELSIFTNKEIGQMRVLEQNNIPLFCLNDVCRILDIQKSHIKSSIIREFGDCLDKTYPIKDSMNRTQQVVFINELQLYYILMHSHKPKSKIFRHWVINEVFDSQARGMCYRCCH